MVNIGVVGYGYWGPNLVRNFFETPGARVAAVADLDPARRELAERRHPGLATTGDIDGLLADPQIDAVAIATPASTHYELGLRALQAGKHVWLEKPMTETSAQARELAQEAAQRDRVLLVDHTFIYTPAVRKMAALIASGEIGDVYYVDSTRVNLGLFQRDVSVICDLAVHDFAIMDHLLKRTPRAVSANGINHFPGTPENLAYVTLYYDGGTIGHINVSWLAPVKVRQILVGGSRRMITYDDLEPSEKLKVYDPAWTCTTTRTASARCAWATAAATCGRRSWPPPKRCASRASTSSTASPMGGPPSPTRPSGCAWCA
jgi:predicted dehydrogenase